MSYKYLDDVATADVAFKAFGKIPEKMFKSAADATLNVLIEDIEAVDQNQIREIFLQNENIEILLFQFLEELIYIKDAELLLLRPTSINIEKEGQIFNLNAEMYGEKLNSKKHKFNVDIKAVTLHKFSVQNTSDGWEATVVLDI